MTENHLTERAALLDEAGDPRTTSVRLDAIYQALQQVTARGDELNACTAAEIALAGNPNASPALLQPLLEDHAAAVLKNPAFVLAIVSEPAFFTEVSYGALKRLLQLSQVPEFAVKLLAAHPAAEIAEAAQLHVVLRGELGEGWRAEVDGAQDALDVVASDALRELAALGLAPEPIRTQIEELAIREGRPPLDFLFDAPKSPAAHDARPPLPRDPELLMGWLSAGPSSETPGGNAPEIARTLRDVLLRHDAHPWQVEARRHLAEDPEQSAEVLTILAEHYLATVRGRVAGNPSTPAPVLELLCTQSDFPVQERLAANPSASPRTLLELSRTNKYTLHTELMRNPNLDVEVLHEVVRLGSPQARLRVARHPHCSRELLLLLAGDTMRSVRCQVAAAASDGEILERMIPAVLLDAANDEDPLARWIALSHPAIPAERLAAATRAEEWRDRLAAAMNSRVPESLREQLCDDGNALVRVAARRTAS